MFPNISTSNTWKKISKVNKGWSADEKYYIETDSGEKLLLRISDLSVFDEKRREFEAIKKFSALGFEMSAPVDFGLCENGERVFMLLTWVDGLDLERVLPGLPLEQQYALGRKAGLILRQIHSLPLTEEEVPLQTKLAKKERQLERYLHSDLRMPGDQPALDYFERNKDLLWKQPPAYLHGDFHPGNMILTSSGDLALIDFNRWEIGDPYEEFYKLESFGTEASVPFCIGEIDSYFSDNIPEEFWKTMAVYVAHASLFSIKWAEPFGQAEVDQMTARCRRALQDYAGFQQSIPNWYKRDWSEQYSASNPRA